MKNAYPKVGIDDISIYIPSLYLDIEDLAKSRNIEGAKLKHGLGLDKMAVPDASEDVITMAAEAIIDLTVKNQLKPEEIGRIYVGTESMVDGSKPIASYVLGILQQHFDNQNIHSTSLIHCDAVDMVFACIGAVDAMQNSLDYIRLNPDRKAIVVSTDWAKYELNSPGESTQGAGAIAILLSTQPRMLEIDDVWGVATQCEHDFFKPLRRKISFDDIIVSNGIDSSLLGREVYTVHKDTPVYDGHFSNECYTDRITDALHHYMQKSPYEGHPFDRWSSLIFHLPYAYHARRIFVNNFVDYLKKSGQWDHYVHKYEEEINSIDSVKNLIKYISKTTEYKSFVAENIEPGERASSLVGNLYTGSIFLSLISSLSVQSDLDMSGQKIGFFAYGSGSKSKVFEGKLVAGYAMLVERINLFPRLQKRLKITIDQYEYLHKEKLLTNLDSTDRRVIQSLSGWTETNKYAREYLVTD